MADLTRLYESLDGAKFVRFDGECMLYVFNGGHTVNVFGLDGEPVDTFSFGDFGLDGEPAEHAAERIAERMAEMAEEDGAE